MDGAFPSDFYFYIQYASSQFFSILSDKHGTTNIFFITAIYRFFTDKS